jgi:hypothetical protein
LTKKNLDINIIFMADTVQPPEQTPSSGMLGRWEVLRGNHYDGLKIVAAGALGHEAMVGSAVLEFQPGEVDKASATAALFRGSAVSRFFRVASLVLPKHDPRTDTSAEVPFVVFGSTDPHLVNTETTGGWSLDVPKTINMRLPDQTLAVNALLDAVGATYRVPAFDIE